MKKNILIILSVLMFVSLALCLSSCAGKNGTKYEKVKVSRGNIKASIQSNGIVEPRNRLEIKPPVAGRVEQVLVVEGERVKKGKILAWISSSDRAALLDAAREKGEAELKYWEDLYKPTPIVAPLDGFIIQRAVEPGQTVLLSDPILVMADRLIIKAQVDETDLSSIHNGQPVNIELDAFQGKLIAGRVEHIAYESKIVNNVTIYEVNVLPASVPSYFRAGMSATLNFILQQKDNVLTLPLKAINKVGAQSYVFVQRDQAKAPEAVQIKTGLENSLILEVVSGLDEGNEVIVPSAKMVEDLQNRSRHGRGMMNPFQKGK